MNITGGTARGRKVQTVKSQEVRPTSSKVRESIFNIIQSRVIDAVMLDLFAGSGIMGIEALSRGAKKVIFVEKNPKVAINLKQNLSNFDFDYEFIQSDALTVLSRLQEKFDIIFLDPPYAAGLIEPALQRIKENNLLIEDGIIIIEHTSDLNLAKTIEELGFNLIKVKKYGDTSITLIEL